MDPAHFKPEDIKEHSCISCGAELEFWKDDVKITCHECNHINFNPNLGNTCLCWCKSASICLGNNDIHEWIKKYNTK
jgi:hypothetical protein